MPRAIRIRIAQSAIAGRGAFADEDIPAGTRIMELSGRRVSEDEADELLESGAVRTPDDLFQVRESEYLVLDPLPLAINHSCDPNAGLRGENTLVALRDIRAGEELFYDYSTVVGADNDGWTMPCRCGAAICRTTIGSILSLPRERAAYYRSLGALPDFIAEACPDR